MPFVILLVCLLSVAGPSVARAQSAAGAVLLPGMGEYSHPIATTSADAQKFFDQGLALLYNFNHAEAERSLSLRPTGDGGWPERTDG